MGGDQYIAGSDGNGATHDALLDFLKPYIPDYILVLLRDPHVLSFTMALLASTGTFIGGIIVVVLARLTGADPSSPSTARLMAVLQAFSAGVMLYITCFDLIPEAVENIGTRETMLWFFGGVVAFGILEEVILHGDHESDEPPPSPIEKSSPDGQASISKNQNTSDPANPLTDPKTKKELLRTSLITFLALSLHNLPEGLGVYLSALSDIRLGSQLAVAIMLHNIPEGMAVAIPLYAAYGNVWKVLMWTLLNGLAEPAGVVIGGVLLHSYLSPQLLSRCLAGVGGIMACISIHELQPMAIKWAGKGIATTSFFSGMFVCFAALEAVNEWFGGHDSHIH
ncbi:ZIP zinc transporter-domain-containing protein [Phlyctochytrium arcticum]|nr:ZIP zinc transporter-domain-containing protein [Phlyctochytrium arcticum]